jgi:tripartite ATP-independent transporter DctM subunit
MNATILFGAFVVLMVAGVPLAVALGLAAAATIAHANMSMMSVPTTVYGGIAKYPLLALPLFVLAGLVFDRTGMAASLVKFASSIVGNRRGGLAAAAIIVCMILGGVSGSGVADAAAVGAIMIPAMAKAGYPKPFSASLIAAGGTTDVLIPPSVALIVYSILVPQANVQALFAAGIVPGILAGIALIGVGVWLSVRHGFGGTEREQAPPFWKSLREALWALASPVVILGGMRSGLFTPTEAAVVAVVYGLAIGIFVYEGLSLKEFWNVLAESAEISAVILLIVGLASVFGWAIDTIGVFNAFAKSLTASGTSETAVLIAITVMLMIAGTALDAIATYFIFLPFLIPVAIAYNWDLVWFGVIITLNVAIGAITPPTAVNLMVTSRLAGIPIESTFKWALWMTGALTAVLLLLTFVPEITLFLPRKLGYL